MGAGGHGGGGSTNGHGNSTNSATPEGTSPGTLSAYASDSPVSYHEDEEEEEAVDDGTEEAVQADLQHVHHVQHAQRGCYRWVHSTAACDEMLEIIYSTSSVLNLYDDFIFNWKRDGEILNNVLVVFSMVLQWMQTELLNFKKDANAP